MVRADPGLKLQKPAGPSIISEVLLGPSLCPISSLAMVSSSTRLAGPALTHFTTKSATLFSVDEIKIWLPPLLTLLGTLIVVVFTAWLNNRVIVAHIDALRQEMLRSMTELKLELKTEIAALRLETVEMRNRVERLEGERRILR